MAAPLPTDDLQLSLPQIGGDLAEGPVPDVIDVGLFDMPPGMVAHVYGHSLGKCQNFQKGNLHDIPVSMPSSEPFCPSCWMMSPWTSVPPISSG